MKTILLLALLCLPFYARAADQPGNLASWFEIPVTDMDRAVSFYQTILSVQMTRASSMGVPMAFFPHADEKAVSGALIKMDSMRPGAAGPLVYLNGGDDLQVVADRIPAAGGTILVPKTLISPEVGNFAVFLDTEGNKLGLFSPH